MVILAIFAIVLSLVMICRLCFSAATLALPLCVGIWTGYALFHAQAGWVFSILAGFVATAATLVAGHLVLALGRHPLLKIAVVTAFAGPAAIVGYTVVQALMTALHQPGWSCMAVAVIGATITGVTAVYRVVSLSGPPSAMSGAGAQA